MTGNQHGYPHPPRTPLVKGTIRHRDCPVSHTLLTDERLIEVQYVRRRYKIPTGEEAEHGAVKAGVDEDDL